MPRTQQHWERVSWSLHPVVTVTSMPLPELWLILTVGAGLRFSIPGRVADAWLPGAP